MKQSKLIPVFLLLLTAMIWGFAFTAQSIGASYVGPFTFLTLRTVLACIVLLPVIIITRRKPDAPPFEMKTLIRGSILAGAALFFASAAQQAAIAHTTAAKSGFITAMYVVLVPVISILLGRRVSLRIWAAVALSVVGLYLLSITDGFVISSGDALTLLCALLFSFQILFLDRYSPHLPGVLLAFGMFVTEGVLSILFMLLFEKVDLSSVAASAPAWLYAGIFSSGVGYTLQSVAQKEINPTIASLIMCLESVFAAMGGVLILHQHLTPREILGCTLMLSAIVLSQLPVHRRKS